MNTSSDNGHTANGQSNGQATIMQPVKINDETFNIRELLEKFFRFWPLFIISIGIAITVAYFYNRYSQPRFVTNTTLLIKDRRNSSVGGGDSFLEGMSLVNIQRNVENEVSMLKSYSIAEATIRELDFGISYYQEGKIRTSEVYGNFGLKVSIDSSHTQLFGLTYTIEVVDSQTFKIKTDQAAGIPFDVIQQKVIPAKEVAIFKSGLYRFNELIEGNHYKFKITKTDEVFPSGIYLFRFHTIAELAGSYAGAVQVRQLSKTSSVVDLSMEMTSPEKGIAYLNKLAEVYISIGLDEKNMIAENTLRFIDNYINEISDSLSFSEDRLQRFRTDNRFFDLAAEGTLLVENLEKIKEEREIQQQQLKYYNYLLDYVVKKKDFSDIIAPSVARIDDPILIKQVSDLSEAHLQRKRILATTTENHPQFEDNNKRIQAALLTLEESLTNATKISATVIEGLSKRIATIERATIKLPSTQRNLKSIERKFILNEDLFVYLLKKRAEAGIAKAANLPDNKVIDHAARATQIFPKAQYNYTVAFVIGLLVPIVLILILSYFNNAITNRKELESLTSIPILGVIGHNNKPSRLVVVPGSKSVIAEAFRSLRSNLQYVARNKERKTILITSTISGEGKTFSTNNLAYVLALSGKKTLLMEIDLRKPTGKDDFGISADVGLTHYLVGKANKEQIIKKTQFEFLDVIQAGEVPPNPSEILMDEKMEKLMLELQDEYDYILMDSSPIGLVSDAFELIKFADLVLFVVRQNYTKRDYVSKLEEIYQIESARSFNIILNDAKMQGSYGGYYGYGRYYGHAYDYQGYYDEEPKSRNFIKKLFPKRNRS
ncbi:MAG: polysaccharide biosynthesis tyrosine autokinase [Verrucomicrobia bacterium]|nr:polysaccharide biosynthesis tyrosine autokinase [Cytophagales bacterium]